jgi:OOP family OmpA-OmpF porin
MKKMVLFATAALLLFAGTAMAESIAGKVGVTARGGASYIFDSEFTEYATGVVDKDIKADTGWTAGGGIMYGITDNLAVTFDVIYLQTKLNASDTTRDIKFATGKTVDFALGAQWRFMPKSAFVPYIGAGLDVLWNKADITTEFLDEFADPNGSLDVDPTYGGHLSVGADYFITPNIALNAEIRGLYSTKGDMKYKAAGSPEDGMVIAEYNPSNISGFVGIRFFFGGAKESSQAPAEEMRKTAEASAGVEQNIIEKGRITLNVQFDTGKAIVKPAYYKNIEDVADVMKKYPNLKIVVEGHTDNVGGEKLNRNLSQKRADAIKEVMVKNFKIEPSRITAKGFGYSKAIGDNSTKEGRQSNRRVESAAEYTVKK